MSNYNAELLKFLDESPSRFHAVANLGRMLDEAGYKRISESHEWDLEAGGKYYVTKNGSALIAFRIPTVPFKGFMMSASHSDSPSFHVKVNAEMISADGYVRINTEKYGGCHMAPWMDRPLTVSGRLLIETENGIETKLVYVDKDLMMIPNVAIHMNRNINDGYKYDPKCDSIPMFGLSEAKGGFMKAVAEAAGVTEEQILGHDLYLNIRQKGFQWGVNNEFISSAALDDLQCAFGCYHGFMNAAESSNVPVFALFDNEEVGSNTKQGANGTFLEDTVEKICAAFDVEVASAVANSFMVSADNAHAVHPNHPEYADATHRPKMNGGIVIKHGTRYATDGASQAIFVAICKKAGVPLQYFFNRSDLAGGGTLGCISISHVSLNTVDIGLPQLAMHSCIETGGSLDTEYLVKAMTQAYSMSFTETNGTFTLK